ncbi:MAG TPA: C45 family peptidase [Urbifossiella sp.]|nr:C45 family peptidase [Urbifossiella sp.]
MRTYSAALLVALLVIAPAAAGERKSFPAAKYKAGELRYIDKVPVLTLRGKPAEMGEQFGILAIRNAPDLTALTQQFLKDSGQEAFYPVLVKLARTLKPNFPKHHLEEMEAAAQAADRNEDRLYFANTVADLSSGLGCSTIVVQKERSKTGAPLFGRNFDWLPTKGIAEHTLIVVYKGEGKHAFAAITVSPIEGVISGMNDAGLSLTINEISIRKTKDKAEFNPKGTPLLLSFRRVLEGCTTVAEAEKLLRSMERTTTCCLTLCDKNGGAVFEITPKNLEVRSPENGVCCCTNHFRTAKLMVQNKCWRFDKLAPLCAAGSEQLGVKDVFQHLDEVHQGKATLQSMVFEPKSRVLNLAYGEGPATRKEPHRIDLGQLFDAK